VKRLISFLSAASFLLASCTGNASLWGQYVTPTPEGGNPPTSTSAPAVVATQTPAAISPFVVGTVTPVTPASTFSEAFVTQEVTSLNNNTPVPPVNAPTVLYYAQSGDWLPAVAIRFGVDVNAIASPKVLPEKGLLDPGTLLIIPDTLDHSLPSTPALQMIPDNELIFSATAIDFDISNYVKEAGGYISGYREYLGTTGWTSGAREIERLAYENSVNPRL
jgi:LysM repeat protein